MAHRKLSGDELVERIEEQCVALKINFRLATRSWTCMGESANSGQITRILANKSGFSNQAIGNALEVLHHKVLVEKKAELRKTFAANDQLPRDDRELRKFLKLIERPLPVKKGEEDRPRETDQIVHEDNVVAMKQWLWQIKRSVAGKPARWQVAPVFWCRENGTGKSYNCRERLLKPIEEFTRFLTVDDLTEKFSAQMFANTVAVFFDEFAGIEAVNAATFKAVLTGKPWDARAMWSENGFFSENRTSALATSNLPPPHGYEDSSGARRFWSIHCDGTPSDEAQDRVAALDSIDYWKIYAAVRTDDPCPHETAPRSIREHMEKIREDHLRTKSSLESWLIEMTEQTDPGFKLKLTDVMASYTRYCGETRQRVMGGNHTQLGERLKALGQIVVNDSRVRYMKGRCLTSPDSMQ